jgi:predicted small secreted protein
MKPIRAVALAAVILLACAPSLSGCATTSAAGSTAVTPAQAAQRAMLAAETAFNVAATAEIDAKGTGLLKGDNAAKADGIRKQAYTVLVGLRATYALGKSPDPVALLLLTNQLLMLAGQPVPTVATPIVPTL